MHSGPLALPLLDYLAYRAGCAYLSDLRFLDEPRRAGLAALVRRIPAGAADAGAWNDALEYLTSAPPERTAEAARERLIAGLTNHMMKGRDGK